MKKIIIIMKIIIIIEICVLIIFSGIIYHNHKTLATLEETQTIPAETEMTVDDVISVASTEYFIVKDIDTWAILESDVYMEREVVEIAICDDMEDTLCLFIKLDENEEPHIRKIAE